MLNIRIALDIFLIILFIIAILRKEISLKVIEEILKPRTIFTMMFYAAFVYLILKGTPIPPELNTIISTLFGFWFGQRQSAKKEGEQK